LDIWWGERRHIAEVVTADIQSTFVAILNLALLQPQAFSSQLGPAALRIDLSFEHDTNVRFNGEDPEPSEGQLRLWCGPVSGTVNEEHLSNLMPFVACLKQQQAIKPGSATYGHSLGNHHKQSSPPSATIAITANVHSCNLNMVVGASGEPKALRCLIQNLTVRNSEDDIDFQRRSRQGGRKGGGNGFDVILIEMESAEIGLVGAVGAPLCSLIRASCTPAVTSLIPSVEIRFSEPRQLRPCPVQFPKDSTQSFSSNGDTDRTGEESDNNGSVIQQNQDTDMADMSFRNQMLKSSSICVHTNIPLLISRMSRSVYLRMCDTIGEMGEIFTRVAAIDTTSASRSSHSNLTTPIMLPPQIVSTSPTIVSPSFPRSMQASEMSKSQFMSPRSRFAESISSTKTGQTVFFSLYSSDDEGEEEHIERETQTLTRPPVLNLEPQSVVYEMAESASSDRFHPPAPSQPSLVSPAFAPSPPPPVPLPDTRPKSNSAISEAATLSPVLSSDSSTSTPVTFPAPNPVLVSLGCCILLFLFDILIHSEGFLCSFLQPVATKRFPLLHNQLCLVTFVSHLQWLIEDSETEKAEGGKNDFKFLLDAEEVVLFQIPSFRGTQSSMITFQLHDFRLCELPSSSVRVNMPIPNVHTLTPILQPTPLRKRNPSHMFLLALYSMDSFLLPEASTTITSRLSLDFRCVHTPIPASTPDWTTLIYSFFAIPSTPPQPPPPPPPQTSMSVSGPNTVGNTATPTSQTSVVMNLSSPVFEIQPLSAKGPKMLVTAGNVGLVIMGDDPMISQYNLDLVDAQVRQ
jgi:hypothetical protein